MKQSINFSFELRGSRGHVISGHRTVANSRVNALDEPSGAGDECGAGSTTKRFVDHFFDSRYFSVDTSWDSNVVYCFEFE